MKLKKINCPNCTGTLDMKINNNSEFIFCPYCGQQIHVDNGKKEITINKNININKTNRKIDEADVIRAKTEAKENRNGWLFIIGCVIFVIVDMAFLYNLGDKERREIQQAIESGKVCAGADEDYTGEKYEVVMQQLETLGFTNITTIDLDNSGLAFWNAGEVESISINGKTSFDDTNYFEKDATIIIKYQ